MSSSFSNFSPSSPSPSSFPSESLRTPLASRDFNAVTNDLSFSVGGRYTRSVSRRLRRLLRQDDSKEGNENDGHDGHVSEHKITGEEIKTKKPTHTTRKKSHFKQHTIGRWEPWERRAFLRGLRKHGSGHWKKIGETIPTRTTVQVKTHAQVMLKKQRMGIDIFQDLDNSVDNETNRFDKKEEAKKSSAPIHSIRMEQHSPVVVPKNTQASENLGVCDEHCKRTRITHNLPLAPKLPAITTTTVTTTTTVSSPQHIKCVQPTFQRDSFHFHPYRFTPSFDSFTAASRLFSGAFLPSQFQAMFSMYPLVAGTEEMDERLTNLCEQNYDPVPQEPTSTNHEYLAEAEVQAITALLGIRHETAKRL